MNVIFIMSDSFRRDHLGCYGNQRIRTPNLDRFAQESIVFDRAYITSYATLPNRWDTINGRYGFPFRGWQPLDPSDTPLAEILAGNGYTPVLIYDTPMLGVDDFNYTRGYQAFNFVRGQHFDPYTSDMSASLRLPAQAHKMFSPSRMKEYFRNTANRRHERQHMVARTVSEAIEWLEVNNRLERFLLWVDMWDPHEPFDPPSYDWDRYRDRSYSGDKIIYPAYGRPNYMTADELQSVRALYAGKISLVDRWVGRLLEKIELLGLTRDTLIVWTSDHGHLFGEHDLQGKPIGVLGTLYEETARIPLIVRHPEGLGAGQRVSGLVQPPDLLPSILDFLDVPVPDSVEGKSFWPMVAGDQDSIREAAFSARFPRVFGTRAVEALAGQPGDFLFDGTSTSREVDAITATTERWSYICSPADRPSELYDLEADPGQEQNVAASHPEVADELRGKTLEFLEQHGADAERLRPYTEGSDKTPLPRSTNLWGFRDDQGLWITFINKEQAEQCVDWEAPGPRRTAEETTFGAVLDDNPKNLVRIGNVYWAEDLL